MGFFALQSDPADFSLKQYSNELLHSMQCKICPLNNPGDFLDPIGPSDASVYLLAEAPGGEEVRNREPLIGKAGRYLRNTLGHTRFSQCRVHNTLRCRPPENRDPHRIETEACRPYIEADIAEVKPEVIVGFGKVPLKWILGDSSATIASWRGRWIPVKIRDHYCWFFPAYHPAFIIRNHQWDSYRNRFQPSIFDQVFERDLGRVFEAVADGLPDASKHYEPEASIYQNLDVIEVTHEMAIDYVANLLAWAKKQRVVGVDIETDGLRPYREEAKIATVAIGTYNYTFVYNLDWPNSGLSKAQVARLHQLTKDFLEDPKPLKVAHNQAFEQEWFAVFYGVELLGTKWGDTQAQAYILDERRKMLSLEDNVHENFGFSLKKISNIDRSRILDYKMRDILYYNALDTKYTHGLYERLKRRIRKEGLKAPYKEQSRRSATMVLTQMKGMFIDFDENERLIEYLEGEYDRVYREIQSLDVVQWYRSKTGQDLNPHSPKEVLRLFRDYLNRSEIDITDKKGNPTQSVKESVLETIDHPLAGLILEARKYDNLVKRFGYPLAKDTGVDIQPIDKKVHPNFNTVFTVTGRLSADNPPIQQFPKRRDKYMRRQVVAPEGYWLVSVDFGQLEARVAAMVSGDENLVRYIWDGYDIHGAWAEWFAKREPRLVGGGDYVTDPGSLKKLRDLIKNGWVFPIIYGAQALTLAGYMGVSKELAKEGFDLFWDCHPGIWHWQRKELEGYRKRGYVELLTGRRRHEPMDRNKILNTNIQGVSADIVVDAMERLSELAIETKQWQYQPLMQIHDDLSFYIPKKTLEADLEEILYEMLTPSFDWATVVPLMAEVEAGSNWADLTPIGEFSTLDFAEG